MRHRFPDDKPFVRKSLGTRSLFEARQLRDALEKQHQERWKKLMAGDVVEDALHTERRCARDNPEAYDRFGLPTLSTAETIGERLERLERLAGRLGCLDEFMAASSQADLPDALSENNEGQELLKALEREKGGLTWKLAGEEFLRQGTIKASTGKTYMSQWGLADETNVPGPQLMGANH